MNSNFDRQVDFAAASEYFQPNSLYICILYDILSSFFEVGKNTNKIGKCSLYCGIPLLVKPRSDAIFA